MDEIAMITCNTSGCTSTFSRIEDFEKHCLEAHLIEKKAKHPGGRPCEFCADKENILKKVKAYLDQATGERPQMVYLGEICIMLGIHKETLQEWAHKKNADGSLEHAEFSVLIKNAELIQETRLQQRVLGRYNPTGAIFLLKTKHGYIESEKQILAGDPDNKLEIVITEDSTRQKYEDE